MKALLKSLVRPLRRLRNRFPSKVPVGVTEFNNWVDSFFEIYDMPTKDKRSVKFALATMIMHMDITKDGDHKPNYKFFQYINSAAAKQVASNAFQEIKLEQESEKKAALENVQSTGA